MDLSLRTETFANEDQSWLASAHGTDSARSITIDYGELDSAVVGGRLASGTPLANMSGGKFGLYNPSNGARNVLAGFLFTTVSVGSGDVQAALLDHGKVWAGKLPNFTYTDAAAKQVLGRIIFADQPPVVADDESSSSSGSSSSSSSGQ